LVPKAILGTSGNMGTTPKVALAGNV